MAIALWPACNRALREVALSRSGVFWIEGVKPQQWRTIFLPRETQNRVTRRERNGREQTIPLFAVTMQRAGHQRHANTNGPQEETDGLPQGPRTPRGECHTQGTCSQKSIYNPGQNYVGHSCRIHCLDHRWFFTWKQTVLCANPWLSIPILHSSGSQNSSTFSW